MRITGIIAGILLGATFMFAGLVVLLGPPPPPEMMPPPGPALDFMKATGSTGYMKFIKIMEVLGGILVAIPKTRRAGLLVLGPIIVNILMFNILFFNFAAVFNPMVIAICVFALFLVYVERRAFRDFLVGVPAQP